jgi:hypothetical protein
VRSCDQGDSSYPAERIDKLDEPNGQWRMREAPTFSPRTAKIFAPELCHGELT